MVDDTDGASLGKNPAVLSPMAASLFAAGVVAAELRDPGDPARLLAAEAAQCAAWEPKRRAEFAAGRHCAHRALHELGGDDGPILSNADRSPRWPAPIVGSITHTDGFCAAVAARADVYRSLGIDAEAIGRITPQLHARIFTPEEMLALDALDAVGRPRVEATIFSAKEAFYKCQYPITHAWRNFGDVSIEVRPLDSLRGEFVVRPARASAVRDWGMEVPLRGRFCIDGGVTIAGIAVPRR